MDAHLFDMHVHLGWFARAGEVAAGLAARGALACAVTVTPGEYLCLRGRLAGSAGAVVGVGAHPWWVADARLTATDAARAASLAREARVVGEIGLDHSDAHVPAGSDAAQADALATILAACDAGARAGHAKLLSVHAVRAATSVLDLLEESGCADSCSCVLHWFSGTSDELRRAVADGCYFSVGEPMLRTRRGREYTRQLPAGRLLLETDLPPCDGAALDADDLVASLRRALDAVNDIRGARLDGVIADTSARLLGL